MTVAVGAKYPWGDLCRLPPPESNISEAVILASDSRFSRKSGSSYTTVSDVGTKLFPLGKDFAAVYAGISAIGELCLDELRWKLSKETSPNSLRSRRIAEQTFRAIYRHKLASARLRAEENPLYILLGACTNTGSAELYLI